MPICLLQSAHHVAQNRRRFLRKSDSPKAFMLFICIVMSEMLLGNHFSHDIQKVIAISVMFAISNPAIQFVCLPVDQFREYLHEKCSFGDDIKFNTNRLISYLNKVFPNQSLESKDVTISTGKKVMVFRHSIKQRSKVGKDLFTLQERQYQRFLSFLHMVMHLNGKRNAFH